MQAIRHGCSDDRWVRDGGSEVDGGEGHSRDCPLGMVVMRCKSHAFHKGGIPAGYRWWTLWLANLVCNSMAQQHVLR